jgi:hypothetical protein
MDNDRYKLGLMAGWTLVSGLLGYAIGVTSVSGLIMILAFACIPPLVIQRYWSAPAPSLSEAIAKAKAVR